MNISELLENYKGWKNTQAGKEEKYKWDFIKKFSNVFDNLNDSKKFSKGYIALIHEDVNFRPYDLIHYNKMFFEICKQYPEENMKLFRNLLDESVDIENRIIDFVSDINKLREKVDWKVKINFKVAIFFLFTRYPEKYPLASTVGFIKNYFKYCEIDYSKKTGLPLYLFYYEYVHQTLLPLMKEKLNANNSAINAQDFVWFVSYWQNSEKTSVSQQKNIHKSANNENEKDLLLQEKNRVFFSQEKWKEILISDLIPNYAIEVLKMIYDSSNHQNSCYGLAKKFGGHPSRFISPIANAGKKIVNSFKIDGVQYYEIFFKGHWNNENKFVWKMREELLFAIKEVFYNSYTNGNIGKENKKKIIEKDDYQRILDQQIQKAKKCKTIKELEIKYQKTSSKIKTRGISQTIYERNQYLVELVKRKANGICQKCKKSAPFITKNGEPYLEVHHIKPLADGGEDSINNTLALCPNCHRELHFGKKSS